MTDEPSSVAEDQILDGDGKPIRPGFYVERDMVRNHDNQWHVVFRLHGDLWYFDGAYCWQILDQSHFTHWYRAEDVPLAAAFISHER